MLVGHSFARHIDCQLKANLQFLHWMHGFQSTPPHNVQTPLESQCTNDTDTHIVQSCRWSEVLWELMWIYLFWLTVIWAHMCWHCMLRCILIYLRGSDLYNFLLCALVLSKGMWEGSIRYPFGECFNWTHLSMVFVWIVFSKIVGFWLIKQWRITPLQRLVLWLQFSNPVFLPWSFPKTICEEWRIGHRPINFSMNTIKL